jgi:hypothetical protein
LRQRYRFFVEAQNPLKWEIFRFYTVFIDKHFAKSAVLGEKDFAKNVVSDEKDFAKSAVLSKKDFAIIEKYVFLHGFSKD